MDGRSIRLVDWLSLGFLVARWFVIIRLGCLDNSCAQHHTQMMIRFLCCFDTIANTVPGNSTLPPCCGFPESTASLVRYECYGTVVRSLASLPVE